MAKLVKYTTIVGLMFLLMDCETVNKRDVFIIIKNNSEEDIFWLYGFKEIGEWYEKSSINSWLKYEEYIIMRGESYTRVGDSEALKSHLEKGWYKYYIFNYDSIKNIPWERICSERIILKEVTFHTWDDFERCNFEIVYP